MAAQQFITAVYDKIWDLLETHAGFTSAVRVGNRLDFTTGKSVTKRFTLAGGKAPADFPEVSLELGGGSGTAFGEAKYGMRNQLAASMVGNEPINAEYVLVIVTDDKRITAHQLVFWEAMTALRKGGLNWGFSYVRRWGRDYRFTPPTLEATDETGNVFRPVTRVTIPVEFVFDVQTLLT